jgi:hypothetical protein
MAKSTGVGWTTLSVGDSSNASQDIRNDLTNFTFATPRSVQDVTGIDKSAIERLLLLADFSITLNGVFNNTATTSIHAVLRTVPSTSVLRMVSIVITGSATSTLNLGSAGGGNGAVLFTDYSLTRAAGGELTVTSPGVLANGAVPTWS